MANLTLNTVLDIQIMPLKAVQFYYNTEYTRIYELLQESTYKFDAMTMPNDTGGQITVGYTFEAQLHVPQNQYDSNGVIEKIEAMSTSLSANPSITLYLGDEEISAVTEPAYYNSTSGLIISLGTNCTVSYSIEQTSITPRMIMSIKGYFSTLQSVFSTT